MNSCRGGIGLRQERRQEEEAGCEEEPALNLCRDEGPYTNTKECMHMHGQGGTHAGSESMHKVCMQREVYSWRHGVHTWRQSTHMNIEVHAQTWRCECRGTHAHKGHAGRNGVYTWTWRRICRHRGRHESMWVCTETRWHRGRSSATGQRRQGDLVGWLGWQEKAGEQGTRPLLSPPSSWKPLFCGAETCLALLSAHSGVDPESCRILCLCCPSTLPPCLSTLHFTRKQQRPRA